MRFTSREGCRACIGAFLKHVINMDADVIAVNLNTRRAEAVYLVDFIINPQVAHIQNKSTVLPVRETVVIFNQPARGGIVEFHFGTADFLKIQLGREMIA
jgi:hypothetical protein